MATTPNLNLPLVEQSQAQKEVVINEALTIIDSVCNGGVIDKDLATPPGSPSEGDKYIVAGSPTGAWTGHATHIAYYYKGGWKFIVPGEGIFTWVNDENVLYVFTGSAWSASISGALVMSMLGINGATADTTNRLAVRTLAALFTAVYAADGGNGDCQIKINKESAGDTASFIFQANYSGRAEFGLVGDDDFQLKVSPDGSSFTQSWVIDKTSGKTTFKQEVACEKSLDLKDGITAPSTLSGSARIYVDSADGDLKVKFGDGTVKTIVTDT